MFWEHGVIVFGKHIRIFCSCHDRSTKHVRVLLDFHCHFNETHMYFMILDHFVRKHICVLHVSSVATTWKERSHIVWICQSEIQSFFLAKAGLISATISTPHWLPVAAVPASGAAIGQQVKMASWTTKRLRNPKHGKNNNIKHGHPNFSKSKSKNLAKS